MSIGVEIQDRSDEPKLIWFVLRATYRRELQAKELLEKVGIRVFIPMHYRITVRGKVKRRELVPVIHQLVFAKATPSQIQEVKNGVPFLQYMVDKRTRKKITVREEEMQRFIAVAGSYDDHLLYFAPEELNLEKGQKVRICGGEFEGFEGVFVKVKGARDRRVVIKVQGVVAVALASIHPDLIQPISTKND